MSRCPDCSAPLAVGALTCDNCGLPLGGDAALDPLPLPPEHARATKLQGNPQGYTKPSHGRRIMASIVDGLALGGIFLIAVLAFVAATGIDIGSVEDEDLSGPEAGFFILFGLAVLIGPTLYGAILESSRLRGTLGKRLVGLEVRNAHGQPLSLGNAFVRNLVKTVVGHLFWPLILVLLMTRYRQGLHDLAARTFVVEV